MKNMYLSNSEFYNTASPNAIAEIFGNEDNPYLNGVAYFYSSPTSGIYVQVEVFELPDENYADSSGFFGMHIHQYGNCSLPFDQTGEHLNPTITLHQNHIGELPPLLSSHGYAWCVFYDGRLSISDILNKSLIIHNRRDDFTTQPSGDSGAKIACGIIKALN